MNILYIGDIMGQTGLDLIEKFLPIIKRKHRVDLVIAQAENVTNGKGITPEDFKRLLKIGVDFCTGGNWTLYRPEIYPQLTDPKQPIIRPANYPPNVPGLGWKYVHTINGSRVLIISLLGQIVGRDAGLAIDNPLKIVDNIITSQKKESKIATIVNFHGDFSSEKVVIGHYLDGQVTAVVGDHWHVPTADARILPKGTAHITDVGMVGALNSSLGVKTNVIVDRWINQRPNKNELETSKPYQFNAVLIGSNDITNLAISIKHIRIIQ